MTRLVAVEEVAPGIRRLAIDSGPANTLTPDLLAALDAALADALAVPGTRAVLIAAQGGRAFPMAPGPNGADDAARLRAICARLDRAAVPVVALVGGRAMGEGCELALAAHFRVALRNAELGLPDIAIGLPPGAGTTQRLPRLTHPSAALDLMLSGQPVGMAWAQRVGLVDSVVDGDLDAAGLRFARSLIEQRAGPRPAPVRRLPPFDRLHAAVAERRAALLKASPVEAPGRILDCVDAAAMLPYEAALDFEAAAHDDCRDSAVFRALSHVARGEVAARRRAEGGGAAARPVGTVGIWGWGAAAAALAATALTTGTPVCMGAPDEAALTEGVGHVDALLTAACAAGGMGEAGRAAQWARFSGATGPAGLGRCGVVIEAGSGPWTDRERAFAALAAAAAPGAVLVGTGALVTPAALAAGGRRPEDTVWLNLPDLVPDASLAELVCTARTGEAAVATLAGLARSLLRFPLVATGESPVLTVLVAALEAADVLVEEGVSPYAVDRALRGWGFTHGPYEMADRLGLQTLLALRAGLAGGEDPLLRPILVAGQLVAEGRRGRVAGRGYYAYPEPGARGVPDPGLDALLDTARRVLGRMPRAVPDDEIRARVLAGMAQAGAGLLRRGVVRQAVEIDLAMLHGAGLASWRGGPMRAADERGLLWLRRMLRTMAEGPYGAAIWTPDPLLGDLIKTGRGFCDVEGAAATAEVNPA
ncbi:enoyl-CoA hydratase-related protein [Rhodovulum euryhalinum]|uniref:Short chain enoyl-CoA hydratase /3-hydroxyacyl-CoA dehydrogenase n=1 Tax=Rhodovulum euryhalinum TaxID=35805 RepID=A0A4R2K695_9RHOB|nr:enoyl-CoA hydratase-related protein [Rhodovulum euryhalinum]TCO68783.1 short chain enoyl-CoA hydratase /3-hydroxyacyl-CoA dehydrogenase [Rhodovulum euryhalinum]